MVLDDGVADISRSRTIAAQPQAIWDVLADFGALSSWADDVDHSCILNHGPDGGRLGTTRRVQIGRNALVERITEFDPPVDARLRHRGPARVGCAHVANRWTLRPAGDGDRGDADQHGRDRHATRWPAPRSGSCCRGMAKQSDSMLAGLARRMENAAWLIDDPTSSSS